MFIFAHKKINLYMRKLLTFLFSSFCFVVTVVSQQQNRFEIPTSNIIGQMVNYKGFTLFYNEQHEQAAWVAYELTSDETKKVVKRTNKFRPDENVLTGSATNNDYFKSGYDRGHMAPAADMSWNIETMAESFYLSNMSPQVPACNRGIWKVLEDQVRIWAKENKAVFVVTGPVLEDKLPSIGLNKVSVPRYFYKVILDYTPPKLKGIAFVIPNSATKNNLQSFAVNIDSVQRLTGINFFPTLPYSQSDSLEKTICIPCWTWPKSFSTK